MARKAGSSKGTPGLEVGQRWAEPRAAAASRRRRSRRRVGAAGRCPYPPSPKLASSARGPVVGSSASSERTSPDDSGLRRSASTFDHDLVAVHEVREVRRRLPVLDRGNWPSTRVGQLLQRDVADQIRCVDRVGLERAFGDLTAEQCSGRSVRRSSTATVRIRSRGARLASLGVHGERRYAARPEVGDASDVERTDSHRPGTRGSRGSPCRCSSPAPSSA